MPKPTSLIRNKLKAGPVRGSRTGRPIMVLLDLFGRRWSLRILWELRERPMTSRALRVACDKASPTVLNERLKELRDAFAAGESLTRVGASPRVSPFADVRDLGALLGRAGFALPVADIERLTVRYGDFSALVRDLRAHGFTNVLAQRSRAPLRRDTLAAVLARYAEAHGADGRLAATFETIILTGWAPHESQQQPLRPGSAKARLAEALGTVELPAGEKPG